MSKKRGFTLIELLVVIAIIGILSSVVLASLNSARNKAANTATKANLAGARAEAEIFYDSAATPTYEGVCALTGSNVIGDSVAAAATASGATYTTANDATVSAASIGVCHDTSGGWAAQVDLKVDEGSVVAWCVDSTGVSQGQTAAGALGANDITCN